MVTCQVNEASLTQYKLQLSQKRNVNSVVHSYSSLTTVGVDVGTSLSYMGSWPDSPSLQESGYTRLLIRDKQKTRYSMYQERMMTFFYCRGRTYDVTRFALRCYLCLKVEEGHVLVKLLSFFSKSLSNPQALNSTVLQLLLLMLSPAHYSCNSTRCAIYSAHRRFCFHHNQNRILHALPPASIRWCHHVLFHPQNKPHTCTRKIGFLLPSCLFLFVEAKVQSALDWSLSPLPMK